MASEFSDSQCFWLLLSETKCRVKEEDSKRRCKECPGKGTEGYVDSPGGQLKCWDKNRKFELEARKENKFAYLIHEPACPASSHIKNATRYW